MHLGHKRETLVSPADVAQLVGLDGRFLSAELELVSSIRKGEALIHHLEPSYFAAMAAAAAALKPTARPTAAGSGAGAGPGAGPGAGTSTGPSGSTTQSSGFGALGKARVEELLRGAGVRVAE